MPTGIGSPVRPLIRLVVYYAVVAGAVILVRTMWPDVYLLLAHGASVGAAFFGDAPSEATGPLTAQYPAASTALVIFGAFVVMLPVAWVYMLTKRREGYDRSVVQTLIVLPTAICGVVVIVQNSFALAFALAGIVAAVRFRNTLKDTKDAVYIFLAIGVGLAAGVQNLDVALIMSVLFNLAILGLWLTNFGNVYAGHIGDPELFSALSPEKREMLVEKSRRLQEKLSADGTPGKGKPPNALLHVQLKEVATAKPRVEAILQSDTKIWSFVETKDIGEGKTSIEYLIRTKKSIPAATLADRLEGECAPYLVGVEIRPLAESL